MIFPSLPDVATKVAGISKHTHTHTHLYIYISAFGTFVMTFKEVTMVYIFENVTKNITGKKDDTLAAFLYILGLSLKEIAI